MKTAAFLLAVLLSGGGCVEVESFDVGNEYPVSCIGDPPADPEANGCWAQACVCEEQGCGHRLEGEVCCFTDPDDAAVLQVGVCVEGRCGPVLCYSDL